MMRAIGRQQLAPRVAAAADASAVALFVVSGSLSHHHGVNAGSMAADLASFEGGWFAAAVVLRLYRQPNMRRLVATWLIGIAAGVALRALLLGRPADREQLEFLAAALVFTALLVAAARLAAAYSTGISAKRRSMSTPRDR
jgi:hypothetical protein